MAPQVSRFRSRPWPEPDRFKSRLLALFLAALVGAATPSLAADVASPRTVADDAARALWWGDLAQLEKLYAAAKANTERSPNGRSQLGLFRDGIDRVLDNRDHHFDAYLNQVEALTRKWAEENPNSALAQLLYAQTLFTRAWAIRGGSFADKVPAQAWEGFNRYLKLASDHLAARAEVVATEGSTYVYLIEIGRSAGWRADRLLAVAQAGLERDPDEEDIYTGMLTSLLPKWGGNADAIESFVQGAVAQTRTKRGLEMYALLYDAAAGEFEGALFKRTRADWPTMKNGLSQLLSRYPTGVYWQNRSALLACLAQDKPMTRELLQRIAEKPALRHWGSGSNGRRMFDTCTRWARTD